MIRRALLLSLLTIAGCRDTEHEFLTGERCIEGTSYMTTTWMSVSCGQNCVSTIPVAATSCQYESFTYRNPDYIPQNRTQESK